MTDFEFVFQTFHIVFNSGDGFLARLRGSSDSELRLASPQPADRVLFNSETGGTSVWIDSMNAVGQTSYYGPYIAASAWSERKSYAERKLKSCLGLLRKAGAVPLMVGVSSIARLKTPASERNAVLKRSAEAFGAGQLNPLDPAFDYSLRIGSTIGAFTFFNVMASWYQARAILMPFSGSPPTANIVFNEWDGTLQEEGIELRFDVNNKRGLFDGKRAWTDEELLSSIAVGHDAMPDRFKSIANRLTKEGQQ